MINIQYSGVPISALLTLLDTVFAFNKNMKMAKTDFLGHLTSYWWYDLNYSVHL